MACHKENTRDWTVGVVTEVEGSFERQLEERCVGSIIQGYKDQ